MISPLVRGGFTELRTTRRLRTVAPGEPRARILIVT